MTAENPVNDLFPEECIDGSGPEVVNLLGKHGIRGLAYDEDSGCNPGYIFRGEAAFDHPLRCSLEHCLRTKLKGRSPIESESLKAHEEQSVTSFVQGPGGRAAAIFYPHGKSALQHPRDDVFWWLSLMQHYESPTRLIDFTRDICLALYFAIEQHDNCRNTCGEERDLIIYCFPCKNLRSPYDPDNNKCPFKLEPHFTDMNFTVGCQIGLPWMKTQTRQESFRKYLKLKRVDQSWGWDRPYHQNPRLEAQKGMFVYPYDYPNRVLEDDGDSWFVHNLRWKSNDHFNLGDSAGVLPPKRIRIYGKHSTSLSNYLSQQYGINKGTVYERYLL